MQQITTDGTRLYVTECGIDWEVINTDCDGNRSENSIWERIFHGLKNESYKLVVLYAGQAKSCLTYEEVFVLDAEAIVGVAYTDILTQKIGSYHPLCAEAGMYELLCRVARETGKCTVVNVNAVIPADKISIAELTFIYAYVVRLHMQELHRRGMMDNVFMGICGLMQRKSCMEGFRRDMDYLLSNDIEYERIVKWTAPFLILRGDDTCGGVLQRFADDLTDALLCNEQAVIEISGNDIDYDRLQENIYKGIVGFQTAALEIEYFRKLKGAKFQFWFDNPLTFEGILRNLPEDQYVLCQDADHAEWIRTYYHTNNALQFPPGGTDDLMESMELLEVGERPYDVIFMGRYFADEAEKLNHAQREFYNYLLAHPQLNFVEALLELSAQKKNADNNDKTAVEADVPERIRKLKPACRAVIGHFRNRVIETLLQNGIEVQVYGEEWKKYTGKGRENLKIHPEVSVEDSFEEYRKAKIGLNIMSWYKAGMTERIANIMLSGAVCVADETGYLKKHTIPGEELELYRLDELERLPKMIKDLLADKARREQIAWKGYQKSKQEFSWNARARQLVELVETQLSV